MSDCCCCKECPKELHKLYLFLMSERQRAELYKQMIEQKYNLTLLSDPKIDEYITCLNSRFFGFKPQISVPLPSQIPVDPEPKKRFKSVPKTIELGAEREINISEIECRIRDENIEIFGEVDVVLCKDKLSNEMKLIKHAKTSAECSSIFSRIKQIRQLRQLDLSPNEYTTFLIEHIAQLKALLNENVEINKKLDAKKISRILTPLEQRLIQHTDFQNQVLSIEEIMRFKQCIKLSARHSKTYKCFDQVHFYDYFSTYGMALTNISDIFAHIVQNPYGFNTIVYIPLSTENDHTFYTLNKYDGAIRYWTLDSRLEMLTYKLTDIVREFCISNFRKLYKLCLNTNDYIESYKTKYNVLEYDCEQLLQNILFTINFKTFNNALREIVKNSSCLTPTANDKITSYADDESQARTFKRYVLETADIVSTIRLVFDNISETDCLRMYDAYVSLNSKP